MKKIISTIKKQIIAHRWQILITINALLIVSVPAYTEWRWQQGVPRPVIFIDINEEFTPRVSEPHRHTHRPKPHGANLAPRQHKSFGAFFIPRTDF